VVELGGRGGGRLVSHAPVASMEQTVIEHPHASPEYESRETRYVYMSLGSVTGLSSPPVGYQRLDLVTGDKQQWFAPLHTFCEEVVIVPKKSAAGTTSSADNHSDKHTDRDNEDKVWVLASMFDAVREQSCVAIFDGEQLQAGPVSTVWLHHALPHSLHGSFTEQTFLD
jgi:all-trans-8'-apo-beta-carotenal 15,15'-oxygenase